MKLLVRWGALSASFWVATAFIPGIDVKGGFTTYLWVALLFGLLNATLGSLLKLLTLPRAGAEIYRPHYCSAPQLWPASRSAAALAAR